MVEKFYYKDTLIGLRVSKIPWGSVPATHAALPLQLVTLKHRKGTLLPAHMHTPRKRITKRLQECLIVRKGKIKISLYGPDKSLFKYIYLKQGQAFISLNGGLAICALEDCEIFEVKNGPFRKDKVLI